MSIFRIGFSSSSLSVLAAAAFACLRCAEPSGILAAPACVPTFEGMVGWWRGEGNCFDHTRTIDSTIKGTVRYVEAVVGQGFEFDGYGGVVSLGNPAVLQLQDFAIEGWIRRANPYIASNGSYGHAFLFGYGIAGYQLALEASGGLVLSKPGFAVVRSSVQISDTAFHHIAVTKSGSQVTFYVDGAAYPAEPLAVLFGFQTEAALGGGANSENIFWGTIDELAVYNRALYPIEVAAIYNSGVAGKCSSESAPSFVVPPTSQNVEDGENAIFAALVGGTPPLNFQWFFQGAALANETNCTLVIYRAGSANQGSYSLMVSSRSGSAQSPPAFLNILPGKPCLAPPTGLRAWWKGDLNAQDTASTNHGTISGQVSFQPGRSGAAFAFAHNQGFVDLGMPNGLELQDMTIELWVRRTSLNVADGPGGTAALFGYGTGGYGLTMAGDGHLAFWQVGDWLTIVNGPFITDTNFHHVAFTRRGPKAMFYLDGEAYALPQVAWVFRFETPAAIGALPEQPGNGFNGIIDELAVYDRELDPETILGIYHAGAMGKCYRPDPQLTLEPMSQQAQEYGEVTFVAEAKGTSPLLFQWYFEGKPLEGETNTLLVLSRVTMAQAGSYAVAVSNALGHVVSSNALLSVLAGAGCAPPIAGLVSWWPMEGDGGDRQGNNHGWVVDPASFAPGQVGQALSLNGHQSGITLGQPASLRLQDFTIECWIRRAHPSEVSWDSFGIIFGWGPGGFGLYLDREGHPVLTKFGESATWIPFTVTDTVYHHLAVTKSGSTVRFFIDGLVYYAPDFDVQFRFDSAAAIGRRADLVGNHFWGDIDELCVYGRPLLPEEVLRIYRAGKAGKCLGPTIPVIIDEPRDQRVLAGTPVRVSVAAGGSAELRYQWRFNGTDISGETNPALEFSSVSITNAGTYSVRVSNNIGAATSQGAVLEVLTTRVCLLPPSGLVSWWRAEGNSDDWLQENPGTANGSVAFTDGIVGKSFLLDGKAAMIPVGNAPSLQLQHFTIEAWIRRADPNLVSYGSGLEGYIFGYGTSGYSFYFSMDGRLSLARWGSAWAPGSRRITDTNFHHVAVTKSGPRVDFYIDGMPDVSTRMDQQFQFTTAAAIGGRPDTLDNSFYGLIDEVAVYNRALLPEEIQGIYGTREAGKCRAFLPRIALQPKGTDLVAGEDLVLSVGAEGVKPLSYQWRSHGTNLPGATSATLVLTNVQQNQAGPYVAEVANAHGTAVSLEATVTVRPAPPCLPAPEGIVAWWPGEANAADELSPTLGRLSGDATYGRGKKGSAFSFNGSRDAVAVEPALLQFQDLTIECWIKRHDSVLVSQGEGGYGTIFSFGSGGYGLFMDKLGRLVFSKVDELSVALEPAISDTNFHHVAVTKSGAQVRFHVDGTTSPLYIFNAQFEFAAGAAIGARGDTLGNSFNGLIDELSIYNRALSPSELSALTAANLSGKCPAVVAPYFAAQPTNQSSRLGTDVMFRAVPGGSRPMSFQWLHDGMSLVGATNITLLLKNVQLFDAGYYSLAVSNPLGAATTTNALLNVKFPPAEVHIRSTNAPGGAVVAVPIVLHANGNENTLEFSIQYDPSLLNFHSASAALSSSGAVLVTKPAWYLSGFVGLALSLPPGTTFAAGPQEVVHVFFETYADTICQPYLAFADTPLPRHLYDTLLNELDATYSEGKLILYPITTGLEGDVSPGSTGDMLVTMADWLRIGRYVVGLEFPPLGWEFQKADCAPVATLGDGAIRATDWVQAGRYFRDLDFRRATGGPAAPQQVSDPAPSSSRIISMRDTSLTQGQSVQVSIDLQAQGDECALSFSMFFNPALLSLSGTFPGKDATGAVVYVNTNQAAAGRVGVASALAAPGNFGVGPREMVKLSFTSHAPSPTNALLSFASEPVARDISNPLAETLPVSFTGVSIGLTALPSLEIQLSNQVVSLSWPFWATNYNLQKAEALPTVPASWTNVDTAPILDAEAFKTALPIESASRFYRLYRCQ